MRARTDVTVVDGVELGDAGVDLAPCAPSPARPPGCVDAVEHAGVEATPSSAVACRAVSASVDLTAHRAVRRARGRSPRRPLGRGPRALGTRRVSTWRSTVERRPTSARARRATSKRELDGAAEPRPRRMRASRPGPRGRGRRTRSPLDAIELTERVVPRPTWSIRRDASDAAGSAAPQRSGRCAACSGAACARKVECGTAATQARAAATPGRARSACRTRPSGARTRPWCPGCPGRGASSITRWPSAFTRSSAAAQSSTR